MAKPVEVLGRSRPLQVLVYVLGWSALAAISVSQSAIGYALDGDDPPVLLMFKLALPSWYLWAAFAPLIYLAARRFPLDSPGWALRLPVHAALNAAMMLGAVLVDIGTRKTMGFPAPTVLDGLVNGADTGLLTYWTILAASHGVGYYRDSRARRIRTAELAAQLSEARLAALRAQLHPHFLFNTLHAVSAFVRTQPDKAEVMLAELGELLRITMDDIGAQTVSLAREMEFIERYLSIQQTRMGERLRVEIEIEPGLGEALVPNLLLQPLVENAVEHGIADRLGEGRVCIRGRRENGRLRLEVEDDGPGLPDGKLDPAAWRVGLRNTRDRLAHLYGAEQRFELANRPAGGLCARVVIPYRTDPEP